MARSKRNVQAAAEETTTPPDALAGNQSLARVVKAEGNSLYSCTLPDGKPALAELAARFRNTIWIRRGGYVLVEMAADEDRKGSRVDGEIVNVVRDEREWRKRPYWPTQFPKHKEEINDEEDSNVGKMPPSDSEEED
ncbi:hypothetical protein RB597_007141 [Gaeumannomyces tritici]